MATVEARDCLSIGETWTALSASKTKRLPSITVAFRRQRQDWKFKVILSYTVIEACLN